MQDHEAARMRNFEFANLISFAHHEPKKMPKYKAITEPDAPKDSEYNQARARGAMISWALSANKG